MEGCGYAGGDPQHGRICPHTYYVQFQLAIIGKDPATTRYTKQHIFNLDDYDYVRFETDRYLGRHCEILSIPSKCRNTPNRAIYPSQSPHTLLISECCQVMCKQHPCAMPFHASPKECSRVPMALRTETIPSLVSTKNKKKLRCSYIVRGRTE